MGGHADHPVDDCSGLWHLDWEEGVTAADISTYDKDRWVWCVCTCHGYVSDEDWAMLRQKYQDIIAKVGDALSSVSAPSTSEKPTSTNM